MEPDEQWRVPLLRELLDVRDGRAVIPGADPEHIEDIITEICSNLHLMIALVVVVFPLGSQVFLHHTKYSTQSF